MCQPTDNYEGERSLLHQHPLLTQNPATLCQPAPFSLTHNTKYTHPGTSPTKYLLPVFIPVLLRSQAVNPTKGMCSEFRSNTCQLFSASAGIVS